MRAYVVAAEDGSARRFRSWRLIIVVSMLFVVIPRTVAYGWKRYRYSEGPTGSGPPAALVNDSTSGYLDREYNRAYRSYDYCLTWRVRYYKEGQEAPTWVHESACSPTSIGNTIGPRRANCQELEYGYLYNYNCDTTVP